MKILLSAVSSQFVLRGPDTPNGPRPHLEYVQRWVVIALTFAFVAVTAGAVAIGGAVGEAVGHRSAGEVLAAWGWFGVVAAVGWHNRHPAATAGLRALGPSTAVGATLLLVARGAEGPGGLRGSARLGSLSLSSSPGEH